MTTSCDVVSSARKALAGERWAIADARLHVPSAPGLYAIYGDERAWTELGLEPPRNAPLYVGKAERSLASRDLDGHFAVGRSGNARTGGSTVRRSFAALLRDALALNAVPRSLANPGYFHNYALAGDGDERLTTWMHERLSIAVWPKPTHLGDRLGDVEGAVIRQLTPPINLQGNPRKLRRLEAARSLMATEAASWRR